MAPVLVLLHRPISVYRLGEMPMHNCGQCFSAPRGKAGARMNAHTELRAERNRSAREAMYRNRPIERHPPDVSNTFSVWPCSLEAGKYDLRGGLTQNTHLYLEVGPRGYHVSCVICHQTVEVFGASRK